MSKLVYVYGEDHRLLEKMISYLRSDGYSVEYTTLTNGQTMRNVHADIALICQPATPSASKYTFGGLTIDLDAHTVCNDKCEEIHFTPTEFSMLSCLVRNSARAVSRSELLPAVWGFENDTSSRVADDTVKRLRKKLADTGLVIETVWGYGFKVKERQS